MTLEVLDQPRESQTVDLRDPVAVANARAQFARLQEYGYFAYEHKGHDGGGTVIRDLPTDPDARVTFVPNLVGG